jgi:hypothetical protein
MKDGMTTNITTKKSEFCLLTRANRLLVLIALCLGGSLSAADPVLIATRFGPLTTSAAGRIAFRGQELRPALEVDTIGGGSVIASFKFALTDVFLVSQPQGNSCPGRFVYITVSKSVAVATSAFGTCFDDNSEPIASGETITFSMPKMKGDGKTTYTYKAGRVLEDGRQVP